MEHKLPEENKTLCIYKDIAIDRLNTIKESYLEERKRTAAGAVKKCIHSLEAMEAVEPPVRFYIQEGLRTVHLEPFFKGGEIGRDVYRCACCKTQVESHDIFCRQCGRKFINRKGEYRNG